MTTAIELARAVATGETTAAELSEDALSSARQPDSSSVMITVTADRARRQAEASDRRARRGVRLGVLDGVPIVWKDLFDVQGTVTTLGSASHQYDEPAAVDSALVRRAHDGGLVTLGKTTLSEFAFSGLGVNPRFGTPANPLDPAVVPGGSSSGSAVAVASGLVRLAVGTDTSGSVRVPAALCGIVGFRSSPGRYGPHDFAPLSPTLDSVGLFATTVADIAALDSVLRPAGSARPRPAPRPVFVVPAGEWTEDLAPSVAEAFAAAVARLRAAGAEIETRVLPSLGAAQDLMDTHGTIVGAEAYRLHGHRLTSTLPIDEATRRRLTANAHTPDTIAPVYTAMSDLRVAFAADLAGATLLCPTVRHPPPRLPDLHADPTHYDTANAILLRTTMLLSYLSTCGLSLPTPRPHTAVLLSLPTAEDPTLLATAEWTERALDTAHPVP
ncbi:amidase family protein [Nocardia neocaledoniensis]|uniref:amidase family protein n=1 Tax=Nocardia neocaledoniensis TaxID=236511 RepID=UPI0024584D6E|nr:amidase family protein [Nocardia neocaledoniensis]